MSGSAEHVVLRVQSVRDSLAQKAALPPFSRQMGAVAVVYSIGPVFMRNVGCLHKIYAGESATEGGSEPMALQQPPAIAATATAASQLQRPKLA